MSTQRVEADGDRPLRVVGAQPSTAESDPLASLPPVIDLMRAAALLGLGRTTAYKLVRRNEWPTPIIRIGRLIKIPTAPLRELLLSCSKSPRSD
jgi:excisionase family DNA binding protein